eukprot:COSAG01_NODE_6945_length_3429_cov_1.860961_2_plen_210_part_00
MAPTGREGVFVALSQVKNLLMAPVGSFVSGWLNDHYQPDCHACRDARSDGNNHFCSVAVNATSCATPAVVGTDGESLVDRPACVAPARGWRLAGAAGPAAASTVVVQCPSSCSDCPGWESDTAAMWRVVLLLSVISPVLVWIGLPFIRGEGRRANHYAMWRCDRTRLVDCMLAGDGSRGRNPGSERLTADSPSPPATLAEGLMAAPPRG